MKTYPILRKLKLWYFSFHDLFFKSIIKKNYVFIAVIFLAWLSQLFFETRTLSTIIIVGTFWKWMAHLEFDFENFNARDIVVGEVVWLILWYGLLWYAILIEAMVLFTVYLFLMVVFLSNKAKQEMEAPKIAIVDNKPSALS